MSEVKYDGLNEFQRLQVKEICAEVLVPYATKLTELAEIFTSKMEKLDNAFVHIDTCKQSHIGLEKLFGLQNKIITYSLIIVAGLIGGAGGEIVSKLLKGLF